MLDREMRESLFRFIESQYEKVRIIEEKTIGSSRADAFFITDRLTGCEIKSDSDSYTRLPGQIKNYNKYFDENYIVVGKTHLKQVSRHIPPFWGIICVEQDENGIKTDCVRRPGKNPKVKTVWQLRILWKRELFDILDANKMPKYRGKSHRFIEQKLLEKLPEELLKQCVLNCLFERDYTIFDDN